ncbi:GNAT family N-acetyltransferase, partial [Candidatus Venteria ishoeyi]|uniref:GNAT family N-acetyltransferase n=1 Tax=Candidatus Venteria ishoeyi TaxID=1899563 RepID=UPI0011B02350
MTASQVTTYHLEMTDRNQFRPKPGFYPEIEIKEIENDAFINFMLFAGVGLPWIWYSRLSWSIQEWQNYFNSHSCKTYIGFKGKAIVGYFELELQDDKNIEIKFFGLLPQFIGK